MTADLDLETELRQYGGVLDSAAEAVCPRSQRDGATPDRPLELVVASVSPIESAGRQRWWVNVGAAAVVTAVIVVGALVLVGGGIASGPVGDQGPQQNVEPVLAAPSPAMFTPDGWWADRQPERIPAPADGAAAAPVDSAAPAEPVAVAVTLTETSIDGLPDDLVAGVVDVTVTDESEHAGGKVSLTMVEPGTDVETFKTGLAALFAGGPFPDYWLNLAGVAGHSMITLDAGEYFVWIDRPATIDDIIAVPLTVGEGDNDAVIPPTDGGSIRAGDYLFDADVTGGGTTVTFTNSSDNQFHHVVVEDWGTNDPALVEGYLPAWIESHGQAPPPEGIDPEQVNPDFAFTPVFGPGSSGTFEAPFEEGHTYSVMCLIFDRQGDPPHALQHQMYDVFQVGAA